MHFQLGLRSTKINRLLHNLTRDIHETHLKFNSHEELKDMTMSTAHRWTVDNELSFFYRLDMRSIVLSPDECNVVGGAASVRGKVKSKQLNDVESGQQVRFVELGIPVQASSAVHEDKQDQLMSFCIDSDKEVQVKADVIVPKLEHLLGSTLASFQFIRGVSGASWKPGYAIIDGRVVVTPSLYDILLGVENSLGEGGCVQDLYHRTTSADAPHDSSIFVAEEHEHARTDHVVMIRNNKETVANKNGGDVTKVVRYIFLEDCKISYQDVDYTLKDSILAEGYQLLDSYIKGYVYWFKNDDDQFSLIFYHTPWCPILLSYPLFGKGSRKRYSLVELDRHADTAKLFHLYQAIDMFFGNPSDSIQTNQSMHGNSLTALAMRVYCDRRAHNDSQVAVRSGLALLLGLRDVNPFECHTLQVVSLTQRERTQKQIDKTRKTERKNDSLIGMLSRIFFQLPELSSRGVNILSWPSMLSSSVE